MDRRQRCIGYPYEQDMRKMGGLWRYMPITYVTFLIGTLALCAIPPFSGFYSKDTIIEAIELCRLPGSHYAYFCVQAGAFVTALYSFRALFMTFHGTYRGKCKQIYESPWVVTGPLVALAIPSIVIGAVLIQPILYADPTILAPSLKTLAQHDVLERLGQHYHGVFGMIIDSFFGATFWLVFAGGFVAWFAYIYRPEIPTMLANRFALVYRILMNKYGFDAFNEWAFVKGGRAVGQFFYGVGDQKVIDGFMVNGSASTVYWVSLRARLMQTGYLFHYAQVMIIGLLLFLTWLMLGKT